MGNIAGAIKRDIIVHQMIGRLGRVKMMSTDNRNIYIIKFLGWFKYDEGFTCNIIDKTYPDEFSIVIISRIEDIEWLQGTELALYSL
jgi:hypothetical protein